MSDTKDNETSDELVRTIEDLLRRVDMLPTLDRRPEREILGYGDDDCSGKCQKA